MIPGLDFWKGTSSFYITAHEYDISLSLQFATLDYRSKHTLQHDNEHWKPLISVERWVSGTLVLISGNDNGHFGTGWTILEHLGHKIAIVLLFGGGLGSEQTFVASTPGKKPYRFAEKPTTPVLGSLFSGHSEWQVAKVYIHDAESRSQFQLEIELPFFWTTNSSLTDTKDTGITMVPCCFKREIRFRIITFLDIFSRKSH